MNPISGIFIYIMAFLLACCASCSPKRVNQENSVQAADKVIAVEDSFITLLNERFKLVDDLSSRMINKVWLDSLLIEITHQEKVKVIAKLDEIWNDEDSLIEYISDNYSFKLVCDDYLHSNIKKPNSIFHDGDTKIDFSDYKITCDTDQIFQCEDYGFNMSNVLTNVRIIEVCNKTFLYADVEYWCNGIGCGCNLNFIYDLETKKPTFIENYRIPFEGFYLSDFNSDNEPDLLVISQTLETRMKGFACEEFQIRLSPFSYNNGVFKACFDKRYQRNYCYELYGITVDYNAGAHNKKTYSIIKDNWFRK